MPDLLLLNSAFFAWILLPLLIFIARVADVSLGTVRVIFITRGLKYLAPIVGFFEGDFTVEFHLLSPFENG